MSKFKNKKLQNKVTEEKITRFSLRKRGKQVASVGLLVLTLSGAGLAIAHADGLRSNTPLKSLVLPDSGIVNFQYSGTGNVKWSNGETTKANFLEVDGATTFCMDPFTEVFKGANATKAGQDASAQKQWKAMTQYQKNLINNITYIGLLNNASGDKNINLSTQFALWLVEAGQNKVSGLLPEITEVDTSQLNNVVGGQTIAGIESTGADINSVIADTITIIKQAVAGSKAPDFNPNPLKVVAGSSATSTDKNGVLDGGAGGYGLAFDHIKPSDGLSAKRDGNALTVSATPKAIGQDGNVSVWNNYNPDFKPHYIYGTINPDSTVGQTLFATTDPANLEGELKVQTIGLGTATLLKQDADTNTTDSQGSAHLENSEWGLFYKADDKPVKWTDGDKDFPINVKSGEKVSKDTVQLKMTDLSKGITVVNLDYSKAYYWKETKAPEGYEMTTKKYDVQFDEKDKYDQTSHNFIENDKATDRVATFGFMFDKVQDVNGSYLGLNGAEFIATPQDGAKGNPIVAKSHTGKDDSGYDKDGLVLFDGKANTDAGNPNKDGLAIASYLVTETKTPAGLTAINPFLITFTTNRDDASNITGYTAVFKDTVTDQVLATRNVDVKDLVDNNMMFKINLGMFVDKQVKPVKPTVASTATDKADGDKTLGVGDAQIKDKVMLTGLSAVTTYTLESQPVSKDTGKALTDKDGKPSLVSQKINTDKDGNATVDVSSKILDTTGMQAKEITLLTKVKDKEGKVVVEDSNYIDNPSETVKVDKADGHTKVQDKEVKVGTTTVTDKFYYEGLVAGNSYTVKITKAYNHDLSKEIDVDGTLTFEAKDTKGDVDVPVKIDSSKYAGHKITFYEDLYQGGKDKPFISHHDKDDVNETFKVSPPEGVLPHTGEQKALWSFAGLAIIVVALVIAQRDKIKAYLSKNKK